MKSSVVKAAVLCAALLLASFSGCAKGTHASRGTYKVGMQPDTGGVNDQSFNQSAWSGLRDLHIRDASFSVSYKQPPDASGYADIFNQMAQEHNNLIWGVGFNLADGIAAAAKKNPQTVFALIDSTVDAQPSNLVCVVYKAQESSFLVGYIAALKTQTNKVGFIGGISGATIDQFEYGFRAGVQYGAKEQGKNIGVDVRYADSFSDVALGRSLARQMYAAGSDILFSAAGAVGIGAIAEAKAENKLVEGVDLDQSYLAPNNVLISALKNVGETVGSVSQSVREGKKLGGTTLTLGLKEGGVGIPYTDQSQAMCGKNVLEKARAVQQAIVAGKIAPPYSSATFASFANTPA